MYSIFKTTLFSKAFLGLKGLKSKQKFRGKMITCTFISNTYLPLEEDMTDTLKYRLHYSSLEHVLMQREKVRMRKVNRNGSYTSAVKYII